MEVKMFTAEIKSADPAKAFVGDNGIYVPSRYDARHHELLITKELFIEAYNKWIKGPSYKFNNQDDADDWCDD